LAACSSTPSKPAALARAVAAAYSCTMRAISGSSSGRGVKQGFLPLAVCVSPCAAIGDGATGAAPPRKSGCDTRPMCDSCRKILPPRACMADVTGRQPATCSSLQMPGAPSHPIAPGPIAVASVTIRPAVAQSA